MDTCAAVLLTLLAGIMRSHDYPIPCLHKPTEELLNENKISNEKSFLNKCKVFEWKQVS